MSERTIDADQAPPLADAQGPIPSFPPRAVDEQGRLIPLSTEERRARSEAAIRALDAIEAEGPGEGDDDETWREVMKGIDAGRPHRPLFEGMY